MKGDITEEIPAIMRYDQPQEQPAEPPQRSGAILDLFGGCVIAALAVVVIAVLLLQAVVK